jgi:glutaredoxin
MFDIRGIDYVYKEIGTDITREEVMESAPGVRSVPLIFDGRTYIGGVGEAQQMCGGD